MASMIRDGETGRHFIVTCDNCGASLEADSLEGRDELRRASGWSSGVQRPDLCANCSTARVRLVLGFRRITG